MNETLRRKFNGDGARESVSAGPSAFHRFLTGEIAAHRRQIALLEQAIAGHEADIERLQTLGLLTRASVNGASRQAASTGEPSDVAFGEDEHGNPIE